MAGRDDDSDSDSSEESEQKGSPARSSPRKRPRTSPSKHPPPFSRNLIPRPRFSTMLREEELALQEREMYRRNLIPLRVPDPGLLRLPVAIEEKLALQHLEIQRLLTDNQQLVASHLNLRQELAATQEQLQRQREVSQTETQKDEQINALVDRVSKQEVDLRALDSLKDDLEKLLSQRQELSARLQQETLKAQADALQIAALKSQNDGLLKELQHARMTCEEERKASAEHLLHRQAMERSYHCVLEEVGRLRMELANAETRAQGGAATIYGSLPMKQFDNGNSTEQQLWGTSYQAQAGMGGQALQGQSGDSTSGKEWSVHMAPNGRYFYYSSITGVTQWEKPAGMVEDQYQQKTQMQLLHKETSQHSMMSQYGVYEPALSAWSAQNGSGGIHTQFSSVSQQLGQAPYAALPSQAISYPGQAVAHGATQSSTGIPSQAVSYPGQVIAQGASQSSDLALEHAPPAISLPQDIHQSSAS